MDEFGQPTQTVEQYQELQDKQHLDLLVIFWYVNTALSAIPGCIGLFYVGMGSLAGGIVATSPTSRSDPPPALLFGFFAIFGFVFIAAAAVLMAISYLTARNIKERKGMTFCLVASALACLHVPLGLALGVFSLIVLNRPSVKALFS